MATVNGKRVYAHRVALEAKLGRAIQRGMYACHSCDNPSCVNPDHLFEGAPRDNCRDMLSKHGHYLSNRTHCNNGHPYDAANTYVNPANGQRVCRVCRKEYIREYMRRRRRANAAR